MPERCPAAMLLAAVSMPAAALAATAAAAPFGVVSGLLITMLAMTGAGAGAGSEAEAEAGAVSDDVEANYCGREETEYR